VPSDAPALFPYQETGAAWLSAKRHALLADEMGLGKSAQVITAADALKIERILILCPASVRQNWIREFTKFSSRGLPSAALLTGAQATTLPAVDILTCSYDLACKPTIASSLKHWLTSAPNSLLVLDECHFLKSVGAGRTHAVLAKGGLIHAAYRTWALSGTPAPNNVSELYPLLRCFGRWGASYNDFVARFCTTRPSPHPPGYAICGHKDIQGFRALVAPVILRRRKKEVMKDLPAVTFSEVTVEAAPVDEHAAFPNFMFTGREQELRDKLTADRATIEKLVASPDPLPGLAASAKSVSTLRRYVGLQKVPAVIDLVKDELDSGLDKVIIFAIHRDVVEGLRKGLQKYGAVTVYGGTPPVKRDHNIARFMTEKKCRVFIAHPTAVIGTNLTSACIVLMLECDWVPGNNAQAIDRAIRIGQTRPVLVRYVVLAGDEMDRRVQQVLRRKTSDLVRIFD
jgi:SWI/SNF-related matrix-associated actin-dependent regulator 1 of chromatin subfamily A